MKKKNENVEIVEGVETSEKELPELEFDFNEVEIKKKRGRPKKETANKEDLRPFLLCFNYILKILKLKELNEDEIETGINAFFPIWEKYYNVIFQKAVYLPAVIWSVSVLAPRIQEKLEDKTKKEKNEK